MLMQTDTLSTLVFVQTAALSTLVFVVKTARQIYDDANDTLGLMHTQIDSNLNR